MNGDLTDRERNLLNATCFRQYEIIALMYRYAPAEVGHRKSVLSIAAIGGAEELKQSFIFGYGQDLPFAKQPAVGSEIAGEHSYFSNIRLCHNFCGFGELVRR